MATKDDRKIQGVYNDYNVINLHISYARAGFILIILKWFFNK